MVEELAGRVIITWPAPSGLVVNSARTLLTDADSGALLTSAFKLSLVLGTDTGFEPDVIVAEITALVNEDGEMLPSGSQPVMTEEYAKHRAAAPDDPADADGHDAAFKGVTFRTGVFRYAVAEMRVAESWTRSPSRTASTNYASSTSAATGTKSRSTGTKSSPSR